MRPTEFISAMKTGKAGRADFLRGPDRFREEECRRPTVDAIPPEARQWCLSEVEFQPGHLQYELEGAQQMPMLGGRNVFLIRDPEDFKHADEQDVEALRAYLERP